MSKNLMSKFFISTFVISEIQKHTQDVFKKNKKVIGEPKFGRCWR